MRNYLKFDLYALGQVVIEMNFIFFFSGELDSDDDVLLPAGK
jgi:hypothetical protein